MKKWFKKILNAGTAGLLFQAFVPLTGGISGSSNGTSIAGPLGNFFNQSGTGSLAGFFNAAFTLALSAGAILAVLRLAYAGWLYMGAADMWGSKQKAKEVITDAVLGLLLLIAIYIILYQINPNLLNLNVFQSLQGSSSS
jgi:hypothetical protein